MLISIFVPVLCDPSRNKPAARKRNQIEKQQARKSLQLKNQLISRRETKSGKMQIPE